MSIIWSSQIDKILEVGVPLDSIGVKNWALKRDDAINAIDSLQKIMIPILGGDVYILMNNIPDNTYDNWYCDKMLNESNNDFINRSAYEAKRYITNYMLKDVFFAIVPGI